MQEPHLQTSLHSAFASWSIIEQRLRRAMQENHPISVAGLYAIPDVKKVVQSKQQVRDIVDTFRRKDMVIAKTLPEDQEKLDPRETIGFMWNTDYKGEGYRPQQRNVYRRPSQPTVTRVETGHGPVKETVIRETPKAVELVFRGVTLTISKNEETGNTRIVID